MINKTNFKVKDFSKENISPYAFSNKIGTFSQVIWRNSNKLGCAWAQWKNKEDSKQKYIGVVCNYYVHGNMPGGKVYIAGDKCSGCPNKQCSKAYPGLCDNTKIIKQTRIGKYIKELFNLA